MQDILLLPPDMEFALCPSINIKKATNDRSHTPPPGRFVFPCQSKNRLCFKSFFQNNKLACPLSSHRLPETRKFCVPPSRRCWMNQSNTDFRTFSFLWLLSILKVIPSLHMSYWHIPYVSQRMEFPPGGIWDF